MKKVKKIAVLLLLSFFVTMFHSAFPTLAVEADTKIEAKESEEKLTREEKNLIETVKDNPKYKKVRVPFVNGVENSNNGLKISWDKVEGAKYEVEINNTEIKSVEQDKLEFVLNDDSKANSYINFRI